MPSPLPEWSSDDHSDKGKEIHAEINHQETHSIPFRKRIRAVRAIGMQRLEFRVPTIDSSSRNRDGNHPSTLHAASERYAVANLYAGTDSRAGHARSSEWGDLVDRQRENRSRDKLYRHHKIEQGNEDQCAWT